MADKFFDSLSTNKMPIKEAVCIDAAKIYDSCGDKDCLEDVRVFFTDQTQPIIDEAQSVKVKSIEVLNVLMSVEPVPFNKGFYSVDMTFYFGVKVNAYSSPLATPVCVPGVCTFCKKVVLFGSEGNVKVFSNDSQDGEVLEHNNLPRVSVQAAEPMLLSSCVRECPEASMECCCNIPNSLCNCFEGSFECVIPQKVVEISIGLFSIVQIQRQVQMLVPMYDFCLPEKQCVTTSDNPCDVFKKINFPVDEFFPPHSQDLDDDCCCR